MVKQVRALDQSNEDTTSRSFQERLASAESRLSAAQIVADKEGWIIPSFSSGSKKPVAVLNNVDTRQVLIETNEVTFNSIMIESENNYKEDPDILRQNKCIVYCLNRIGVPNELHNALLTKWKSDIISAKQQLTQHSSHKNYTVSKLIPPDLTEEQVHSLWRREKWRSRKDKSEKFPAFIRRVYGDLLGKGLVPTDFRRKDPDTGKPTDQPLYQARLDWIKNNDMPDDIDLPSQDEITDRLAYAMSVDPSSIPPDKQARVKMALAARDVRKAVPS